MHASLFIMSSSHSAGGSSDGFSLSQHSSSQQTQEGARKRARTSGSSGGVLQNDDGIVPAMFQRSKGGDIPYMNQNFRNSIRFRNPAGPGPERRDTSAIALIQGSCNPVKVKQDFAYKLVLEVSQGTSQVSPITRTYAVNVFRHGLFDVNQWGPIATTQSVRERWHSTLGPDAARTRTSSTLVQGVSRYTNSGNENFVSPYRSPDNGQWMFSRLTQQILENIGWNANPLKLFGISANPVLNSATEEAIASTTLDVYQNAATAIEIDTLSATTLSNNTTKYSLPSQQEVPAAVGLYGTAQGALGPLYGSQFGAGKIEYTFQNDGTVPVVIDIVVHTIKKGQSLGYSSTLQSRTGALNYCTACPLLKMYGQGYLNLKLGNRGVADMGGAPPVDTDIVHDSKTEFLPEKCLKRNAYNLRTSVNSTQIPPSAFPIKQHCRDQLIIPAGSQQSWCIDLPRLSYYAPKYRGTNLTADAPVNWSQPDIIQDYSYILAVAASTLPVPLLEFPEASPGLPLVVDRRGCDLSVAVRGTYTETPEPVFPFAPRKEFYINGELEKPRYIGGQPPSVYAVDILDASQNVRLPGDNFTTPVGALNTERVA
ncbi:MAG: putative capsid protein [Circoviridae sp.]|nr:MAG: putative capsid protein [Circoviridae sp.]